jgi:hypothetical protein
VEPAQQRARAQRGLAHRLFLHFLRVAAAFEKGVYFTGSDGLGSLPGGDSIGMKLLEKARSLERK